jgi:glutamate synthase domain-containing protein 2
VEEGRQMTQEAIDELNKAAAILVGKGEEIVPALRHIDQAVYKMSQLSKTKLAAIELLKLLAFKQDGPAELHEAIALLEAEPEPVSLKVGEMPDRPITMPEYIAALERTIERLTKALERLERWANAYPTQVFPKPDLKKAHKVLKSAGMSLGAINADAMRHVLEGVKEIVKQALTGGE